MSKGNQDHQGALLKPDEEDPEPLLWLDPEGRLEPHPGLGSAARERVVATIRICDLNRGALQKSRKRFLIDTRRAVGLLAKRQQEGREFERHFAEWKGDQPDPERSFKFVLRFTLTQLGLGTLAEEDRQRFAA